MITRFARFPSLAAWLLALLVLSTGLAQAAPNIEHWQTRNGLRVYYVHAPELPMLDMRLVFDAGSARDAGKPGLARLTSALLDAGAGPWNADEIASRLESVGAAYGAGALKDMAWVSLRSLSDPQWLEPALETYLGVVHQPRFPRKDFKRIKKQTFVALKGQDEDPGSIASKAFFKAVYGDHPYASPSIGTPESVKKIKRGDLQAFYKQYYVAKNAVLALVGDLSRDQAEQLAERVGAGLAAGERAPALPSVPPVKAARTLRIPFPSGQAHVFVGQTGMRRGDPDYFTLYVGNHIFGGSGFTSRLVKEVRVKRGLAYSVYSYFSPMAVEGPLLMGLQTRVDQAEDTVNILKQTLAGYVSEGPSKAELEASNKNITGGFPLRTASNGSIVEYLSMIGFYGLPLDYLDRFTGEIDAVTREGIREAYQRRVKVDDLITVIVGGEAAR